MIVYYQNYLQLTQHFTGNLALVHYKQGNYPEALNMYTERLAAIWKFYGNVHPSIADTLNNIAAVHDKQGNYVEAILGLCFLSFTCVFVYHC